jgi:hypothetical protein
LPYLKQCLIYVSNTAGKTQFPRKIKIFDNGKIISNSIGKAITVTGRGGP